MNLNQITLFSTRPVETVAFFELLGLRRIVDSLPRYARLECPDGEATLSVNTTDEDTANTTILYFECEHLDDEVARLKSLGLEFEQEPTDTPWLWRQAYIRDPNGNKICLFNAGDNRKNPPWRIN